jgi:hypothetical protein
MPGTGQQNLGRQDALFAYAAIIQRAAALLRLAATTIGRSDTALGAFYRRSSSRAGKAKAVADRRRGALPDRQPHVIQFDVPP